MDNSVCLLCVFEFINRMYFSQKVQYSPLYSVRQAIGQIENPHNHRKLYSQLFLLLQNPSIYLYNDFFFLVGSILLPPLHCLYFVVSLLLYLQFVLLFTILNWWFTFINFFFESNYFLSLICVSIFFLSLWSLLLNFWFFISLWLSYLLPVRMIPL